MVASISELRELNPFSYQPYMSEEERLRQLAPAASRLILHHHGRGEYKSLTDQEAVDAVADLDSELRKFYPPRLIPTDLISYNPEERAYLLEQYNARMEWYAENGIDARPTLSKALRLHILTEDNLPAYAYLVRAPRYGLPFMVWNKGWIAEEDYHGVVLRDLVLATQAIDINNYERSRPTQLYVGTALELDGFTPIHAYPAIQEIATYHPHNRVGHLMGDVGQKVHNKVSGDEIRHHRYYRGVAAADVQLAIESNDLGYIHHVASVMAKTLHPSLFEMPGKEGIIDYKVDAQTIAVSGIFDIVLLRKMARQMAHDIKLNELAERVEDPAVGAAVERLFEDLAPDSEYSQKQDRILARARDRVMESVEEGQLRPLILGRTAILDVKDPDYELSKEKGEDMAEGGAVLQMNKIQASFGKVSILAA